MIKIGSIHSMPTALIIVIQLVLSALMMSCSSQLPEEVETAYQDLTEEIDFNFHVRPILSDRCFHCHGPDEKARKANLRFDVRETAIARIEDKEAYAIVPGKPWSSEAILRILAEDPESIMPPAESKLTLSNKEKAILVKWIEQGAPYKKHWAYIPPMKSELPEIKNRSWARNEIDYFVIKQLEDEGMQPSVEADKETLIRRLSFDLVGLPPTLEQVADFKNDTSTDAYEKLVDRLLGSAYFGERWAWEWLDVARYADTNGFQADPTRTAWPWRDWVVKAFNNNMPYDEFTIKQIAGDLIDEPSREDILATAFNRNHPFNGEGGKIPEEVRVNNVFDRVETVGTTWLGLTLNCSRCHDHKFDAISQKEYYQLFDYFNQTSETGKGFLGTIKPYVDMSPEEDVKKIEGIKSYLTSLAENVDKFEIGRFPRPEGALVSQSEEIQPVVGDFFGGYDEHAADRDSWQLLQIFEYFKNRSPDYAKMINDLREVRVKYDNQEAINLQVMVMDQLEKRRPTHILTKGNYAAPNEEVQGGVPSVLPGLPADIKNDRLALANWMVAAENPLTARVTVNRYWQAFFGRGIVKTIEDFGVQGALPTHPKMLDWLATDFQKSGWDLKGLFKKIVMSGTYRQSSKVTPELLEVDPENIYLARAARMRLPSWMLRDQALAVSGLLVDSIGGKPVKPYQPPGIWQEATFGKIKYERGRGDDLYRRTLYTFWRRIVGPTMLFDNSSRQVCEVKTLRTNTPLHALTTLNDVTYVEAAKVMAEKALLRIDSDKGRLEYIFELVTSRKPKEKEYQILEKRLSDFRTDFRNAPDEAKKLVSVGEYATNERLHPVDHASFTALGSLVLNLDETITRQ